MENVRNVIEIKDGATAKVMKERDIGPMASASSVEKMDSTVVMSLSPNITTIEWELAQDVIDHVICAFANKTLEKTIG